MLTIHDMTHEMFPQYFSPKDPTAPHKHLLATHATRIIAISEYTKQKIMEILGVDEAKIDVIYHGLTPRPISQSKVEGVPQDYLLYVGERRGYKNFTRVAEAFALIKDRYPSLHLVLTGRALSHAEQELFTKLGIASRVFIKSDVSDEVLDKLYHNARLFLYPSLCEGFGIPILEAWAQRCPVVLSHASCFPEIGGDACAYFNAQSTDELCDTICQLLDNESLRSNLIAKGTERLRMFTWEQTARQTEQTYSAAIREQQQDKKK